MRQTEVYFRVNKMVLSVRADVTTAKTLQQLYTGLTKTIQDQVKTIILTNFSDNNIYFGVDGTVSTSNAGGILYPQQKLEISLVDTNWSPYFVADSASSMGIEIWG